MTVDVWTDWRHRAKCLDVDPDLMHPGYVAEEIAAAKAVCGGCPVRAQCLRNAIDLDERDGIWGGYTYAERRNLVEYGVAQRHFRPKATCPTCGREIAIEGDGLRRHNRPDPRGSKGWSVCRGMRP